MSDEHELCTEGVASGLPKKYIINSGHDNEGLDFVMLRNVQNVMRYNWGREWTVDFGDGCTHNFARDREIRDFAFLQQDGVLLMGFMPHWPDVDEQEHEEPQIQIEVDPSTKTTDEDCPICTCELSDQVWKCPHCGRETCYECMQEWIHTPCAYTPSTEQPEYFFEDRHNHNVCPSCQTRL
jgi:hypothetical protein